MVNKKLKVAVIGDGISALSLLERLGKDEGLRSKVDLTWIAAPQKAPGCSYHSTALITDHGIDPSFGGLGSHLLEALEMSFGWDFLNEAPGVYEAEHWAIDDGTDSFARRYGRGHPECEHFLFERPLSCRKARAKLIDVRVFLPALKKRVEQLWHCDVKNELVFNFDGQNLSTDQGIHQIDYVFWCTGAGVTKPQSFLQHPRASRLKRVEGLAYHFKIPEWTSKNFALTLGRVNIISRAGDVFVGGTTQNETARIPDARKLSEQLKGLSEFGVRMSEFKNRIPLFWGGPRQKGQKKKFLIEALNEKEFAVLGTYKNGYSLSQLGAFKAHTWLLEKLY